MKKLFIGNVRYNAPEEDLRSLFEEFGTVSSLKIIFEAPYRRFGFVDFVNDADAYRAVNGLHGHRVMGRRLWVEMSSHQGKYQL